MGVERGALKAHIKAHGATNASFGFVFHAFGALKPVVGIVVAIDKGDVEFFSKGDVLIFAQEIFFAWMDVGIVKNMV